MRYLLLQSLISTAVCLGVIVVVDGIVYRDPHVRLPGGYAIAAISPRSPCELYRERTTDPKWYASWEDPATCKKVLLTRSSGRGDASSEFVELSWTDLLARPDLGDIDLTRIAPRLPHVTLFTTNPRYVAGIFQDAYFLLDTERHEQAVWMDATKWRAAVEKVGLSTRGLWSPRNRLLQTRDAPVVAVYIMACGMAVLLPIGLNRWRRRTNESSF